MKNDTANIQQLLCEMYDKEWEANIVEGRLPNGQYTAYQSGRSLRVGDTEVLLDNAIRGKNFKLNARVVGDKVFLSYVQ